MKDKKEAIVLSTETDLSRYLLVADAYAVIKAGMALKTMQRQAEFSGDLREQAVLQEAARVLKRKEN